MQVNLFTKKGSLNNAKTTLFELANNKISISIRKKKTLKIKLLLLRK